MTTTEFLTSEVPDPAAARRFLDQLSEANPSVYASLEKDAVLLSDIVTLISYSPLFAATLLQDPSYIAWLKRERSDTRVRDKHTLLESLGRFALTHSSVEPNVMLARFRRRELIRIFLRDVRRLATIAEITEEISNLADAILEHAMRLSQQQMDNRFGAPQEQDQHGRIRPAEFCIVALGKLGSRELNYSSDIDLLFIFSGNGATSGSGMQGVTPNLEYFSRLTQAIIKLVGGQGGEGAAYRVDMRLRPHGRIGPLALTLADTIKYYLSEAAPWERQVLIRSRASAGVETLFQQFFNSVEDTVFSPNISVETALENVALSKQKIDLQNVETKGTDIKLGPGGIREIEFIAQSLQLAYGGMDKWLRVPHTLKSLDRLAQRGHLSNKELTQLFAAYDFFRHLEHILQIENGLQTHSVPFDIDRRSSIAKRCALDLAGFNAAIDKHKANVQRIFARVFEKTQHTPTAEAESRSEIVQRDPYENIQRKIKEAAPRFLEIINAHSDALATIARPDHEYPERNYTTELQTAIANAKDFAGDLSAVRRAWYRNLIEIVVFDAFGRLELSECKRFQTWLAEASIDAALAIAKKEAEKRYGYLTERSPLAVLALGKLGSGGMDYFSDLDLVFVHGDTDSNFSDSGSRSAAEYYSRIVEIFSTALSSITKDGHLYRVDLRLRPHGSDGPLVISHKAIIDYFKQDADIWELLAYVNLRAVAGDLHFAREVETELRSAIHERALNIDPELLAAETRSVRDKLEKRKVTKRSNEIDFKFGPGGLLDVYFAVRFLLLRFGICEQGDGRSTQGLLLRLADHERLPFYRGAICSLNEAYGFLSSLDHSVRLVSGRTSKVGLSFGSTSQRAAGIPSNPSSTEFNERLIASLITVRDSFDKILSQENL